MGLTVRSTWAPLGSDRWTQSPGPSSHIPVQTLIFLREASSPRAPNTFGQPHCPCRVLPEPHFVLPPISEGCAGGPVSQCTSLISPPHLPRPMSQLPSFQEGLGLAAEPQPTSGILQPEEKMSSNWAGGVSQSWGNSPRL